MRLLALPIVRSVVSDVRGADLDANLVVNGTFDTDLASWSDQDEGAAVSQWAAGTLELTGDGSNPAIRSQTLPDVDIGRPYIFEFDSSTSVCGYFVNAITGVSMLGHNSVVFIATSATPTINFNKTAATTANVDNVSVKPLNQYRPRR